MDEILENETQKISAAREAPELMDYYYIYNDIYQVDKIICDETKYKLE